MKKTCSFSFSVMLFLAFLLNTLAAATPSLASEDEKTAKERNMADSVAPDDLIGSISLLNGDLFRGIRIHSPVGDEINRLYFRNRQEIFEIIDRNPGILWETLDLVLDLMPALQAVPQNDGKLHVDKRLYARATDLFWRCESLAGQQLSGDLKKAKELVESRTTELDSHRLLIDLNR